MSENTLIIYTDNGTAIERSFYNIDDSLEAKIIPVYANGKAKILSSNLIAAGISLKRKIT